jgi:predicted O-methyltransferase YrrM
VLHTAQPSAPRAPNPSIARYYQSLGDVPGWLEPTDYIVLELLDKMQEAAGVTGDILEIGVYQGRTAILLQYFCRGDERLSVCDVFEKPTGDAEDEQARETFYADLTRESFERHFLQFHPTLPEVHQCRSQELAGKLGGRSFRLVHVDGSHVHASVQNDLTVAKKMLAPGGVVVVDDYRREHTPGVAAAVWKEVAAGGLVPICLTPGKLYGCWQHPEWYTARLRELAAANPALRLEEHELFDRQVLRLSDAAVEGPSREEFLAVRLATLQRDHAAHVETSQHESERARREIDEQRIELERHRAELESRRTEIETALSRLEAARREIVEKTIELAKRELQSRDLKLHVSLLERALGIRPR